MATNKVKPEDSAKTKEILTRVEEARTSIKKICASALATPTSEDLVKNQIDGVIKSFTTFLKGFGTNYQELVKSSLKALNKLKNECLNQVKIFLKNNKDNELAKVMAGSFFGNSKPKKNDNVQPSASDAQVADIDKSKRTFIINNEQMTIEENLSVKFKELSGEYAYDQMVIQEYQEKVKSTINKMSNLALTEKTFKEVNGRKVGAPVFLSIRNKAEMTVRYEEMKEELKELIDDGEKFVIVSQHRDASKRCSPLQGLLYKLDVDPNEKVECVLNWRELGTRFPKQIGVLDGNPYYSLKEAMSYGLFSYNCRHRFIKYIPGMKVTEQYKYDDKLAEQKRKVDTKMRQMERAIRQAKERQVLSIDSKERRAYQIRSKQLQEKYINFARKYGRVVNTWRCSISRSEQAKLNESYENIKFEQITEHENEQEPLKRYDMTAEVNLKVISQKEYENKFIIDGLRKSDCKKIADKSRQVLNLRNKTLQESIFAYNITKNEIIDGKDPGEEQQVAYPSPKMKDLHNKSDEYIIVHNHPQSGMPSIDDLNCLLRNWNNSKCCYVICHNGDVWSYRIDRTTQQPFDKVSEREYNNVEQANDRYNSIINGTDENIELAKRLSKNYGLIIERK